QALQVLSCSLDDLVRAGRISAIEADERARTVAMRALLRLKASDRPSSESLVGWCGGVLLYDERKLQLPDHFGPSAEQFLARVELEKVDCNHCSAATVPRALRWSGHNPLEGEHFFGIVVVASQRIEEVGLLLSEAGGV